jgi:hypothetical protein
MTGSPSRARSRSRVSPPRSRAAAGGAYDARRLLTDGAYILLGATLSCMLAVLVMIAIGAFVALVFFLMR